jgi:hypothetical protein
MSIFSTYQLVTKIDMERIMDVVQTTILRDPWDVDKRLAELQLTKVGLLAARDVAIQESANATAFHPANSAGTFSYHHGTWALRDQFVGKEWAEDRVDGIEAIRNETLKIKIAFCNVDLACDDNHSPKPRSKKGAGAERASGGGLFGDLPQFAPRPADGGYALYYLMVDENGAVELTRPVLKAGTFVATVERIYLADGNDDDGALLAEDGGGPADNFNPQVVRK